MARNVDPDAIFAAREVLRGALGRAHAGRSVALHDSLGDATPFARRRRAPAAARLRNVRAVDARRRQRARRRAQRAHRQIADADNMTERLAALAALSLFPGAEREHALEASRALRRRSADPRQMVRVAGADPGDGDARRACAR